LFKPLCSIEPTKVINDHGRSSLHNGVVQAVNDAQIDIDIEGSKYKAEKHGVGEYEVILKDKLKPGVIAITATIQAGELNDLLAAELDLHADEQEPSHGYSWKGIALWTGAGLFALMALGAIVRFRQQARTA
jgi:hypothetical protein